MMQSGGTGNNGKAGESPMSHGRCVCTLYAEAGCTDSVFGTWCWCTAMLWQGFSVSMGGSRAARLAEPVAPVPRLQSLA